MAWATSPAIPNCVARIQVTGTVSDLAGKPVNDAELWYVDTLGGLTAARYATHVATSDSEGRLNADVCYMSHLMYCAQRPKGQAAIRFLILKEGYGALKVNRRVDAARLVQDGWAVTGDPCKGGSADMKIGRA